MKVSKEYLIKKGFKLIPASEVNISKDTSFNDEYVYDIEVGDTSHTFFANDILVHNSIYVRMDNVLKLLFNTTKVDWDDPKVFNKIKNFVDTKFQGVLNRHVGDFICDRFKTEERRIEFKREKLASEGEYLAKKRYVVHVRDDEGLECDKFSCVGVDIAKNELPQKIKDLLQDLVEDMMKQKWIGNEYIQPALMKIYETYSSLELNDVAYIKNLTTPKETTGFLSLEKGAGIHAKSAEFYNQLLDKLKIADKYEKIKQGDRFHYMYIDSNNKYGINSIAWKDRYPKEFNKLFKIDINTMFNKTIISPLKTFLINHKASNFDPNNIVINGKINLFDL